MRGTASQIGVSVCVGSHRPTEDDSVQIVEDRIKQVPTGEHTDEYTNKVKLIHLLPFLL